MAIDETVESLIKSNRRPTEASEETGVPAVAGRTLRFKWSPKVVGAVHLLLFCQSWVTNRGAVCR